MSRTAPGNTGGDCPRCGTPLRMIGHGESCVLGAHCDHCDLLLGLATDVMTAAEATEKYTDNDEHDVEEAYEEYKTGGWGPDPWG